ncbi:hypothetical protein ACRAWG_35735 [Methylobacterium sp. P31]
MKAMPKHLCLHPYDPYAQQEVLVEFVLAKSGILLVSAVDAASEDILPDLEDMQRADLLREIADAYPNCWEQRT